MNLQHLFSALHVFPENIDPNLPPLEAMQSLSQFNVTGLFNDARKVIPGSVFVAIRGVKADGHSFISEAIQKGAIALVVEDKKYVPTDFGGVVLQVPNSREALDILASQYHGDPSRDLFCFGVTGTNGKTSVTYMIEGILDYTKIPTGVIGTVNHHLGDKVWPSEMTTPDPIFLQQRLREFKDAGARAVAMEVSSHALDQHRIDSVALNTVIFTNLTRDHLDYHQSMAKYFDSKQRLFTDLMWKTLKRPSFAVINIDDKFGRRLRVADPTVLWTYGHKNADFTYHILSMDYTYTEFEIKTPMGNGKVKLPMSGRHNVMNALAAIAAAMSSGVPLSLCCQALSSFHGVPGRLQAVQNTKNVSVFVDYAHSPDALENVLKALQSVRKNLKSNSKIWTIFGCGGDRDKGKRPLMAAMALKYSDYVVVTSDNPRTEDPQSIINDILTGIPGAKTEVVLDRRQAIFETLKKVPEGDVVLIAGKGHEDYQIIGTEKLPFSDVSVAEQALAARN